MPVLLGETLFLVSGLGVRIITYSAKDTFVWPNCFITRLPEISQLAAISSFSILLENQKVYVNMPR